MSEIVRLKHLLNDDFIEAAPHYKDIVATKNEKLIEKASVIVANFIRSSSLYKRKLFLTALKKLPFTCLAYLSFQFQSINDTVFPRRMLFTGKSVVVEEIGYAQRAQDARYYTMAAGSNRFFNLGVVSDGSPIEEPRLVNDPPNIRSIRMSNSHTLFQTQDGELYGCGKASCFLPDLSEHTEGEYIAVPVKIEIPGEMVHFRAFEAIEGGSKIYTEEGWFIIGTKLEESEKIASNCGFVANKNSSFHSCSESSAEMEVNGHKVTIYVNNKYLMWSKKQLSLDNARVKVFINGVPTSIKDDDCVERIQVLKDGTIYIQSNVLLKGRLHFLENSDDGFNVMNKKFEKHFDTKYSLVAFLEEIPGTIGIQSFGVSPDGQNLVMVMRSRVEDPLEPGRRSEPVEKSWRPSSDGWTNYFLELNHRSDLPVERIMCLSADPTKIYTRREENGDIVDIPRDLDFRRSTVAPYDIVPINREIFLMMYPESKIEETADGREFVQNGPAFSGEINLEELKPLEIPINTTMEFVPGGTDPSFIMYFITSDKKRVPCHKYPILLHSRFMDAMQSYATYGSYQQAQPDTEQREIKTIVSKLAVRNALRGMLNISSLFSIKIVDLIDCIYFYNYHLMDELFEDAFNIFMHTVNDFTIHYLYDMYNNFPQNVIDGLTKQPYLVFNSLAKIRPPREVLDAIGLTSDREKRKLETQYYEIAQALPNEHFAFTEAEILKHFVDLEKDAEDFIWECLDYDYDHQFIQARKEANRLRKIRNANANKNKLANATPSSPIIIQKKPRNDSLSLSAGSPMPSMSPSAPALPIPIPPIQPRTKTISNSFDDFPEMSPNSPNTPKGKNGRFAPKGMKFKKANEILLPPAPVNPWKTTKATIEEEAGPSSFASPPVDFKEVVQKEKKLQENIKTGFKKVQLLPHVETEELAVAQIGNIYRKEYENDAVVTVELIGEGAYEELVWGHMPGLVRRK